MTFHGVDSEKTSKGEEGKSWERPGLVQTGFNGCNPRLRSWADRSTRLASTSFYGKASHSTSPPHNVLTWMLWPVNTPNDNIDLDTFRKQSVGVRLSQFLRPINPQQGKALELWSWLLGSRFMLWSLWDMCPLGNPLTQSWNIAHWCSLYIKFTYLIPKQVFYPLT
jgi:hypothetical protein